MEFLSLPLPPAVWIIFGSQLGSECLWSRWSTRGWGLLTWLIAHWHTGQEPKERKWSTTPEAPSDQPLSLKCVVVMDSMIMPLLCPMFSQVNYNKDIVKKKHFKCEHVSETCLWHSGWDYSKKSYLITTLTLAVGLEVEAVGAVIHPGFVESG